MSQRPTGSSGDTVSLVGTAAPRATSSPSVTDTQRSPCPAPCDTTAHRAAPPWQPPSKSNQTKALPSALDSQFHHPAAPGTNPTPDAKNHRSTFPPTPGILDRHRPFDPKVAGPISPQLFTIEKEPQANHLGRDALSTPGHSRPGEPRSLLPPGGTRTPVTARHSQPQDPPHRPIHRLHPPRGAHLNRAALSRAAGRRQRRPSWVHSVPPSPLWSPTLLPTFYPTAGGPPARPITTNIYSSRAPLPRASLALPVAPASLRLHTLRIQDFALYSAHNPPRVSTTRSPRPQTVNPGGELLWAGPGPGYHRHE